MEFSDNELKHSNELIDKENQPHPLTANQPSILDHLKKHIAVKQPHPSSTTTDQPHPSTLCTRYYKLAKEHLANSGCGSVSHDAWMLACEYFNSVQPHPLNTTFDWSDFILH